MGNKSDDSGLGELEPDEDLSLVVRIILETDRNIVGSSEIKLLAKKRYNRHISSKKAGRKLSILGQEVLEPEEYEESYKIGGNNKWNIDFLREGFREQVIDLGNDTTFKEYFDPEYNPEPREVDTSNENVINAYEEDFPEFQDLNSINPKSISQYLRENETDIDKLNQFLLKQENKKTLQVSEIIEHSGGWAPDAVNPGEVNIDNEEIYGKYAVIKENEKGPISNYKIVEPCKKPQIAER